MAMVAAASGYSRMALYRHFGSRAGLLTALLAHIDEAEGVDTAVREVLAAPTPRETVERLIAWWAAYVPTFAGVARGVLAAKDADPDLRAAWDDRMGELRRLCDAVARRAVPEGRGHDELADELWALLSVPLWIQLSDDGWDAGRYRRTMTRLALGALATR